MESSNQEQENGMQITPDELYSQIGSLVVENRKLREYAASLEAKIKSFQEAIEEKAPVVDAEVVEPSQNGTMPKKETALSKARK